MRSKIFFKKFRQHKKRHPGQKRKSCKYKKHKEDYTNLRRRNFNKFKKRKVIVYRKKTEKNVEDKKSDVDTKIDKEKAVDNTDIEKIIEKINDLLI